MKNLIIILLALTLVNVGFCLEGWAQPGSYAEMSRTTDDELNLLDLLIARPLGVMAGIAGSGIFIATLPFTVPTRSVDKASKILITNPFHFSFSRQFPDKNLKGD